MKKILLIALVSVFLSSCGVGTYTMSTGLSDKSGLSFVADKSQNIMVTVDGQDYELETIKLKAYRNDRNIKKTADNTIELTPGTHEVKVTFEGNVIYSQKVFISAGENKIIEL